MAIRSYKMPMHIVYLGVAVRGMATDVWIIAGCAFATYLANAHCMAPIGFFSRRWDTMDMGAFLDDITLTAEGPEEETQKKAIDAGSDLLDTLQSQVDVTIAWDKVALTATTKRVALAVARGLPLPSHPAVEGMIAQLGADTRASGRCRANGRPISIIK